MDSWIEGMKATAPIEYNEFKLAWDGAKAGGATDGGVSFYTDSAEHCVDATSGSEPTTPTYPLVSSLVIRFKNEATAATLYKDRVPFMPDPTALKAQGWVAGTSTGLGANAVVLTSSGQFLAYWQNRAFVAEVSAVNFDYTTASQVAGRMDSRIR